MKAHSDIPKQTLTALLLAAACFILPLQASAAAYMKLGDIKGEAQDLGHEEEIDVLSWCWGMSQEASAIGGGGGAGKVNVQDLSFTKYIDKATPKLFESCVKGTRHETATLTLTRTSAGTDGSEPVEYFVITMSDCVVTSVSTCDNGNGDRPTEEVTLNFSQVEVIYTSQDPATGGPGEPVIFAWDFAANTEG